MDRRQERRSIHTTIPRRLDGDETGEVLVLRPEPITDPRPHRRTRLEQRTRMQLQLCRCVRLVVGVHGAQKTEVVRNTREVRHEIRNHHTALPSRSNRLDRAHGEKLVDSEADLIVVYRHLNRLAVIADDQVLGIEEIRLRRTTAHEEKDHTLRFRCDFRSISVRPAGPVRSRRRAREVRDHGM